MTEDSSPEKIEKNNMRQILTIRTFPLPREELMVAAKPAQRDGEETLGWSTARPPLSAEDIRLHAWLAERLAVLHYERYGLWPKLRRFLFGNRLVRWCAGACFKIGAFLPQKGEPCGSCD